MKELPRSGWEDKGKINISCVINRHKTYRFAPFFSGEPNQVPLERINITCAFMNGTKEYSSYMRVIIG